MYKNFYNRTLTVFNILIMLLKAWSNVESKSGHHLFLPTPKSWSWDLRFSNKGLSPDKANLMNSSFHMLFHCTKCGETISILRFQKEKSFLASFTWLSIEVRWYKRKLISLLLPCRPNPYQMQSQKEQTENTQENCYRVSVA